jgi:hypothetical protein
MSLPSEGRKPYFAFSTAIIVIDSVVGGSAAAVALGAFVDAPLAVAVTVGAALAVASVAGWLGYAARLLEATAAQIEPLFPSR